MSNSVVTNPLVLDSTGVVLKGPVSIKAILYTAGNNETIVLSNAAGVSICKLTASTGTFSPSITIPGGVKTSGLTVTSIGGGVAYVYLK